MNYTTHIKQETGSHRHCQDRFLYKVSDDKIVFAVADGHGGQPYTRSGIGARIACKLATQLLSKPFDIKTFPEIIKQKFDYLTRKHLSHRPLADWELLRAADIAKEEVYGTTLLCGCISKENTILFQLGDGDIFGVFKDGTIMQQLPNDDNCIGSITSSMSNALDYVKSHFRTICIPEALSAVILMTDGCEGGLIDAAHTLLDTDTIQSGIDTLIKDFYHGDDQTVMVIYNKESLNTELFKNSYSSNIADMKEKEKADKIREYNKREFLRLSSYITLALKKAKKMSKDGASDDELDALHQRIKKASERYFELNEALK